VGGNVNYPPLLAFETIEEYREHFERVYCRETITTFDGVRVLFKRGAFQHAFFTTLRGTKGIKGPFSWERASRMDWIACALRDTAAELFIGWNKKTRCYDFNRRVAIVVRDYVVIVQFQSETEAFFITAFVADNPATLANIRKGPNWGGKGNGR